MDDEVVAAGWYPDPVDRSVQRYWDGEQWLGEPLPADAKPPAEPPAAPEPAPAPTVATTAAVVIPAEPRPRPTLTDAAPVGGMRLPASTVLILDGQPLAPVLHRLYARLVDIAAVLALNLVVNGWFIVQYVREVSPVFDAWADAIASGKSASDLPEVSERASRLSLAITVISLALWFAYEVPAMARDGQTFGKRLFGVRVIRPGDRPLGFGGALHRWSILALPGITICCLPFQLLDCAWCTWDRPLRQCLHDKLARTVVVSIPRSAARPAEGSGTDGTDTRPDPPD